MLPGVAFLSWSSSYRTVWKGSKLERKGIALLERARPPKLTFSSFPIIQNLAGKSNKVLTSIEKMTQDGP